MCVLKKGEGGGFGGEQKSKSVNDVDELVIAEMLVPALLQWKFLFSRWRSNQ